MCVDTGYAVGELMFGKVSLGPETGDPLTLKGTFKS